MKKQIITAFAAMLLSTFVMAQTEGKTNAILTSIEKKNTKEAGIQFDRTNHSFGKIPMGKPVTVTYNFTNTGTAPLIITGVTPGCGCTTGEYSKQSVAPGKKGFITLTYNAASVGNFTKSASVSTNSSKGIITLFFNGEVTPNTQAELK